MPVKHEVLVSEMGGATVLSCSTLNFYNIELMGDVIPADIKKTILHRMHLKEGDPEADFEVIIKDGRPEKEENYNDQKERESKEFKRKRKALD